MGKEPRVDERGPQVRNYLGRGGRFTAFVPEAEVQEPISGRSQMEFTRPCAETTCTSVGPPSFGRALLT